MNEKTLRILEYDKIIKMLSERASYSLGKDICMDLKPSPNIFEVQDRLNETNESFGMVLKWGTLPIEGAKDIKPILKRAKMGYTLSPGELLSVCDILRCIRKIKTFMKDGSKFEQYPVISEIVDSLVYVKNVEQPIENAIVSENEISDRASQRLYSIRKSIKDKNSRVKDKLQSMLQSNSKYLQDPIVTMREGRYVIPVKSEFRQNVQGLVHDQSSSGSTLFIEPVAVVELNNDIKELMLKEKDEIEKILTALTLKVSENVDCLSHDNENIGYLDFMMAKAKFGLDLDGTIPEVNDRGIIGIKAARHPLIDKKKVMPIDIKLGETYKALVITGPNTGGKTVTLKTTGLLTLMTMAGLAIPARDGSKVSVFKNVYADIGDEQSIEQSLSTFSSHMTNIVNILKNAGESTLVLVDELGAGTDPTEGAALAMSILKKLYGLGASIVATTHYSEIKVFAMEENGFENASVEFDIETLRPTYRLLTGIPGKSNAFEISKRLGLDESVIDDAKQMVSKDAAHFEDVIQNLQNKTTAVEKELEEAEKSRREIDALKKELSNKKYKIDTERDKMIQRAQDDAKRIMRTAKIEADGILKELIELKSKASEEISLKQAMDAKKQLNDKLSSIEDSEIHKREEKEGYTRVKEVKRGDEVYVTTLSQTGTVISDEDSRGEVTVQVGIMKVNVTVDKLMKGHEKTEKKKSSPNTTSKIMKQKTMEVSSSIDLRGQTIDEAMYNIEKYLDDAFLAGLENVIIIHGKGTGALREGIQNALKHHRYVKSLRTGEIGEGGSGVTVVEIKK